MSTRRIALLAVLSAALTGGKSALAVIPNVEVVTLLLISYALVLKRKEALTVCAVFVMTEMIFWGVGQWLVLYAVYWPALTLAVSLLPKNNLRVPLAVITGIVFTALFGVLSTVLEVSFMGGIGSGRFFDYFKYRYLSGTAFFITHIVSNIFLLSVLAFPVYEMLNGLIQKYLRIKNRGMESASDSQAAGEPEVKDTPDVSEAVPSDAVQTEEQETRF